MKRIGLSDEHLDIVYEDDHLLALSKPVGQLVIPGRDRDEESLAALLTQRMGCKVFVVHRLDREASGLVIFAKDAVTHRHLSRQFETRRVRKIYWAVVEGPVTADGIVDRPIRQFGSGRMGTDERGKQSLTRFHVLERFRDATLLEVELVTGRRHQIRVHLYSIGHPILGEMRYGDGCPVGGAARLMLHAKELSLERPGGRVITLEAGLQDNYRQILKSLRGKGISAM